MVVDFEPIFKFTEAISLVVRCRDQAEVDHDWGKRSAGGFRPPSSAAGSRTGSVSPGRWCR